MKVSSFLSCEMSHKTVRVIINGVLKTKLAGHVFQYLTSMLLLLVCVNVLRLNFSASLSPSCSRQSRKKSKGPCGLWFRYQPLKQVHKKNKKKKKKKKLKMGIYLVALCFDPQRRKLKTNKRTKKHTVSKTHLWGSTCCPGSSGYSQSFFREMSLLCIFLQSVLIASNSHIDDFCQIDTGFLISRQEKLTPGMLKLGWGTGIETKSRQGE